jgi:hypothetical protein
MANNSHSGVKGRIKRLLCALGFHHESLLEKHGGINRVVPQMGVGSSGECWISLRCKRCDRVIARGEYDL